MSTMIARSLLLIAVCTVVSPLPPQQKASPFTNVTNHICDPRGNPCKDGLIIPMWKPNLADLQRDLFELSSTPHPLWTDHDSSTRVNGRKHLEQRIKRAKILRGAVYFLALIYMFIGVSIIADRFMAAIEVITSKEKDIAVKRRRSMYPSKDNIKNAVAGQEMELNTLLQQVPEFGEEEVTIITVRIWNETVSNLTLMALGSSAPEILLSIIEVVGKNFEAGELGPGTIVGSAAFNLFVIVGFCIIVIPSPGIRKIRYLRVFFLTASWSIFAYIWLYLILAVISPGVVSVAEGLITFIFFPLTVLTAYIVDKQLYQRWSFIPKRYEAQYKRSASIIAYEPPESSLTIDDGAYYGMPRKVSIMVDGKTRALPVFAQSDRYPHPSSSKTAPQVKFAPLQTIASESGMINGVANGRHSSMSQTAPSVVRSVTQITSPTGQEDTQAVNDYLEFERTRQLYMQALSEARHENPDGNIKAWEAAATYKVLNQGSKSRAYYRIQATRKLLTKESTPLNKQRYKKTATKLFTDPQCRNKSLGSALMKPMKKTVEALEGIGNGGNTVTRVYFDPGHYTVMENAGHCTLKVVREGGDLDKIVKVDYLTKDGTATADADYVPAHGTLTFEKGSKEASFLIGIIDDDVFEDDEYFYVDLTNLRFAAEKRHSALSDPHDGDSGPASYITISAGSPTFEHPNLRLDNPRTATVMIFDDDHGGTFQLAQSTYCVNEDCGVLNVQVIRKTGARGKVYLPYHTEDGTAHGQDVESEREKFFSKFASHQRSVDRFSVPSLSSNPTHEDNISNDALINKDYESARGFLVFENEQTEGFISIRIIDTEEYEKDETFTLHIGQPIWFNSSEDGEENGLKSPRPSVISKLDTSGLEGAPLLGDITSCVITITESKDFKLTIDKLLKKTNMALLVGTSSWKDQFVEAFSINPLSDDDKEQGVASKPTFGDYCCHFLTIFWKILFASVPPTDYWGGWCCFIFAIVWIGILTAIIGDLASAFGCTIGLKDSVTAISFVALGTSIPDMFASKVAAMQDEHADASIGNVTGSNAVNVFLGIGLAWSAAAIYHAVKGTAFVVDPGSLAFSVTIYCVLALVVVAVLMVKRTMTKGELGGPMMCKVITGCIFFGFWILYLVLASLESYCIIKGF